MTSRSVIYPVFLPHAGCPFQCVYCNQHTVVTPQGESDPAVRFDHQLEQLLEHLQIARPAPRSGEIAFYGGTFTALPESVLRYLLDTASTWVERGIFSGIRFSTRPDCITPEILSFLAPYPIKTVELGVQSLSDAVLAQSGRGYTRNSVEEAVRLVRMEQWALGLQLMTGLPGDTPGRFMRTVDRTIALAPDFVRIYPTLVLRDTPLARLYAEKRYRPQELQDAVACCAHAYQFFTQAGVAVIRLGLQADPELQKPGAVLAGPYHPAFGYLVRAHWWRERVDERLEAGGCTGESVTIVVSNRAISEVLGPGRCNPAYWCEKWRLRSARVKGAPHLPPRTFEVVFE